MNYAKHYERLIHRARIRALSGYSERHHVVPKCLGGSNSRQNIVRLKREEHYIAHLLLVKMYPDHKGLLWSAICMAANNKHQPRSNKLYGWLRRRFASTVAGWNRGVKATDEARAKMSAAKLGKKRDPFSEETKQRISFASKGKAKSAQHRASLSAARKGRKFGPQSAEHLAKRLTAMRSVKIDTSFTQTPEYRALQSARSLAAWAKRKADQESARS